jgi:hypothetical protein
MKLEIFTLKLNEGCRSTRHKLSITCLFVSSELLFNVLIDSSKYLSFVGLGIQSDLFLTKDGMYYEETDKKADQKTYKMITKLLHEHEGELHKEEIDYITDFTFTESYFYGLQE